MPTLKVLRMISGTPTWATVDSTHLGGTANGTATSSPVRELKRLFEHPDTLIKSWIHVGWFAPPSGTPTNGSVEQISESCDIIGGVLHYKVKSAGASSLPADADSFWIDFYRSVGGSGGPWNYVSSGVAIPGAPDPWAYSDCVYNGQTGAHDWARANIFYRNAAGVAPTYFTTAAVEIIYGGGE